MNELAVSQATEVSEATKLALAGLWVMKKMDLDPADGGMQFRAPLPHDLSALDDVLMELLYREYVVINRKKGRWELTPAGLAYLGQSIDEAKALIDEFDDAETADVVAELRRRQLDVVRARFLWGWVDGELDDLLLFQEQRGVEPVELAWPIYLTSDEFFAELAKDYL